MTTIVMRNVPDDIIIGYDSQITMGYNEAVNAPAPKVFVNNGTILGVAGPTRVADVFEVLRLPRYESGDARQWAIGQLVRSLRAGLVQQGHGVTPDLYQADVLAVVDGRVFTIQRDWSVTESTDTIHAIGSGGDYAKGAMHAGAKTVKALMIASELDPNTGGDLTVTSASKLLSDGDFGQ